LKNAIGLARVPDVRGGKWHAAGDVLSALVAEAGVVHSE
jgi:hypothetical protein